MANVNAPQGFQFRGAITGSPSHIQIQRCFVPASDGTAIFLGDAVKAANSTDSTTGLAVVTAITGATDVPMGVVVGVNPIAGVAIGSENLNRVYRPASTAMYVDVIVDPNALYEIQSNGTVAATDMGKFASIVASPSGSTTTGISAMVMDETSINTSKSNKQFVLVQTLQSPDNAVDAANTRLLVRLVNHLFNS